MNLVHKQNLRPSKEKTMINGFLDKVKKVIVITVPGSKNEANQLAHVTKVIAEQRSKHRHH